MRHYPRLDANQPYIVKVLKELGCSVLSTAALGSGAADILCGHRNQNFWFEIKDGEKPPSARKLTDDELIFHANWRGQIAVVETVEDIMRIMQL